MNKKNAKLLYAITFIAHNVSINAISYMGLKEYPFPLNFILLGIAILLNIGVSQMFANLLVSRYSKTSFYRRKMKKINIAWLYCTKNDFLMNIAELNYLECVKAGHDFWIIDDSTDFHIRTVIEFFVQNTNAILYRRKRKKGYKAGALNDWIAHHGEKYNYFVILDADSILSRYAVEQAILAAEADKKIAIVQMVSSFYGLAKNGFEKALIAISEAVGNYMFKAYSAMGYGSFFGHNALVRTEILRKVKFVEVAQEDTATMARLYSMGYKIKYLPHVIGYEAVPTDYISYRKRQLRWTSHTVRQLSYINKKLPFAITWFVFSGWVSFLIPLLLIFMIVSSEIIALLGIHVTVSPWVSIVQYILLAMGLLIPNIMYISKHGISGAKCIAAAAAYSLLLMFPLCIAIINAIFHDVPFIVTPKSKNTVKPRDFRIEIAFIATFFILGLVTKDIMFIITWAIIPLIALLWVLKENTGHISMVHITEIKEIPVMYPSPVFKQFSTIV